MPPSGECPRRIAPAAAMVDDFEKKKKNTTKTQLLSSFLTVHQHKKVSISKTRGPPLMSSARLVAQTVTITPLVNLNNMASF